MDQNIRAKADADVAHINKTESVPAKSLVESLGDSSDDFDLPMCTLRPGDEGFESCESCQ